MSELQLADNNFKKEVEQGKGLTVVDFWAPWCGPCQMMGPVIEELAKEYEGKVKIGKLNVDENPETSQNFQVMSIPTIVFFKDGKEVERVVGAKDKESLMDKIDELNK